MGLFNTLFGTEKYLKEQPVPSGHTGLYLKLRERTPQIRYKYERYDNHEDSSWMSLTAYSDAALFKPPGVQPQRLPHQDTYKRPVDLPSVAEKRNIPVDSVGAGENDTGTQKMRVYGPHVSVLEAYGGKNPG